jgi:hypothetical protein
MPEAKMTTKSLHPHNKNTVALLPDNKLAERKSRALFSNKVWSLG